MKTKIFRLAIAFVMLFTIAFSAVGCEDKAAQSAQYVEGALSEISFPSSVTSDLTLPTVDTSKYPGVTLSFSSDKPASITNAGVVTRSASQDVKVNFTVTATCGSVSDSKNFEITVTKAVLTEAQKLARAKESLSLGDVSAVTSDITLPSQDAEELGVSIAWETSNADVVTSEGLVIRPAYNSASATATLTATLTLGTETDTKEFNVTVLAKGLEDLNPSYEQLNVSLEAVNDTASLVVTGYAFIDKTAAITRTISLIVHSDGEEEVVANASEFEASTDGEFEITVYLEELDLTAGTWYDLRLKVIETHSGTTYGQDKYIDLQSTDVEGYNTLFVKVSDSEMFRFAQWDNDLKIVREISPFSISSNTNSTIRFVNDSNKLYLEITGSAYFDESTTLEREMTLTISHNELSADIVLQNLSTDADTRKFQFGWEITDIGSAYTHWLVMELSLVETKNEIENTAAVGLAVNEVTTGNSVAVRGGDKIGYFEDQNGFLRAVIRKPEMEASFLNSTDVLSLIAENDKVYLLMQGTAWQTPRLANVADREIKLWVDNQGFDNLLSGTDVSQDGKYSFKADVTGLFVNLGDKRIDLDVIEFGAVCHWEVKQAAWDDENGAIVTKPSSGTKTLTDCGVITFDGNVYKLAVDQWNNIKINVTPAESFEMQITKSSNSVKTATVIEEGGKVYLRVFGTAFANSNASTRTYKLEIFRGDYSSPDDIFAYTEMVEGLQSDEFSFKIDISDFEKRYDDWFKFQITMTEDDIVYSAQLVTADDYSQGDNWNWVASVHKDGTEYMVACHWGQIYMQIKDSNE